MKNYLKTMGYFLLPPTVMAYDKQKHALLGLWLSVLYFILKNDFEMTSLASIIYTLLAVVIISYIIEVIQLLKPNRVFDNKDVIASLLGWGIAMVVIYISTDFK